jgi:hypothetical protein
MLLIRGFFALALLLGSARADDIALVRIGDGWKYLPGLEEASAPVEAWRKLGFDDLEWAAGRSGFSVGYVGADEATLLPLPSVRHASVFFRRTFNVVDPAQIAWLTLRVDYVDGFVAYVNGQEIARRNIEGAPGSFVPYDRLALTSHPRYATEEMIIANSGDVLLAGTNVLAIQVHRVLQAASGWCLSAELIANFNRAPYLQNTSSNRIDVAWKTPVHADTQVEFGLSAEFGSVFHTTNLVTAHVATLTNLMPDTTYYYQVSSAAGERMVRGPLSTFRTFKTAGSVQFLVTGDNGWNSLPQYGLAALMDQTEADLVLNTGDVVYPQFTRELADQRCFSVYQPQMGRTPFFFSLGNHDLNPSADIYLEAFYLPTNSVQAAEHAAAKTSPEHYYSFDHGDVHFVALFVPFIFQHKITVGDAQYRWLTNDLATTRQPWKIVYFHVPMHSSSLHRHDDYNYNGIPDRIEIRDVLLPVFSEYGVDLVFCGHEHGYERFNPTNGVHFITTAGGGVQMYGMTELDAASAYFEARFHFMKVAVQDGALEAQAIGLGGEVFDSMTIHRKLQPEKMHQAEWHSPFIETAPADDGDGNVTGQMFDFSGEPIHTISGQFSNLGRVHVNNDSTYLYIGFEQVMIYGTDNVFLFLESPRLPGVTNLMSTGNGVIDPDEEGADGLDFLENLAFDNFAPSVGFILGDELADGQYRSFERSKLVVNIGQGAFRLDRELSDLPGFNMQQYHSSPQLVTCPGEENANFIELSISLQSLGGLRPGDIIKLGAIVGGEVNLEDRTRFLDNGFLGRSIVGAGFGQVLLEGVRVQLAYDPEGDEDGDGLPNAWEMQHGLDAFSAVGEDGPAGDPDDDQFTNLEEYLAGTDPRDPASRLSLRIERGPEGSLRLLWPSVVGRDYKVQVRSDGIDSFRDLEGVFINGASTNSFCDIQPPESEVAQFYRVRLASELMQFEKAR